MYNSRRVEDLRSDVAANCRVFLSLCKQANLPVLIVGTVRDDEYQLDTYKKGFSKQKKPSFHAQGVGLAFDFCKNVKGHEYDDPVFFARCGEIGERIGFEWGGRWKSFPDTPHLQWSAGRRYTSRDIWAGRLPPMMPLYSVTKETDDDMTQEQFNAMFEKALASHNAALETQAASAWAVEAWKDAKQGGLFDGTQPQAPLTREQAALVLKRIGAIK